MANYATSVHVKAQSKLIGAFQSNELRFRSPEVHKLFVRNSSIMLPDYQALKVSSDRPIEANYFTRTSRALGGAPSHNHTGAQGDSAVITPTFTPESDKFASTLKEANNKIYDMQELQISKFNDVIANFAEGLETVATAFLFANRSGVNVATADGTFDATDDTFEIDNATLGNMAIDITKTVMDVNKYQGIAYDVVCDSIAWRKFRFLANQGNGNSENTSFQFGGVTFIHDPTLTAAAAGLVSAYSKGYWIAVPVGSVAALPWIPTQNRQGISTTVNTYGMINNPIDGIDLALHTYETRSDGTALGGQLQDVTIETQIWTDISYLTNPLSNAGESSLMAFAFV
jgi:hypothetical protein